MKVKAADIRNLKVLGLVSKRNTTEIAQVVKLFQERKIERFDTARSIINDLSSGGQKKQKTGLDKLEFYSSQYLSRKEIYESPLNSNQLLASKNGRNRFTPSEFSNPRRTHKHKFYVCFQIL